METDADHDMCMTHGVYTCTHACVNAHYIWNVSTVRMLYQVLNACSKIHAHPHADYSHVIITSVRTMCTWHTG